MLPWLTRTTSRKVWSLMDAGILVGIGKSAPQIGCGLAIRVPRLALFSRKCHERHTERQCGDKEG